MEEKRDRASEEQPDRTYEPPAVSELGRVDTSTGLEGGSTLDSTDKQLNRPLEDALALVDRWPVGRAVAGVVLLGNGALTRGRPDEAFRWASITKLLTAGAVLVAAEEGILELDEPAGPPGSTIRHLLAHASGLPFDGASPLARPGEKRIYSNAGYELLGEVIEKRAGMSYGEYLLGAVLEPVGMTSTVVGSAAHGAVGPLVDLMAFGRELLGPHFVAEETLTEATSVQFAGLAGVIPGLGRHDPADWGLGFELRDAKSPHWTGSVNSPRTFGHFGGSGAFLWIDPDARLALASLSDREFGEWSLEAWPALSDAVLTALDGAR